eukprot:4014431-Karenia_brevis.AAC.1
MMMRMNMMAVPALVFVGGRHKAAPHPRHCVPPRAPARVKGLGPPDHRPRRWEAPLIHEDHNDPHD